MGVAIHGTSTSKRTGRISYLALAPGAVTIELRRESDYGGSRRVAVSRTRARAGRNTAASHARARVITRSSCVARPPAARATATNRIDSRRTAADGGGREGRQGVALRRLLGRRVRRPLDRAVQTVQRAASRLRTSLHQQHQVRPSGVGRASPHRPRVVTHLRLPNSPPPPREDAAEASPRLGAGRSGRSLEGALSCYVASLWLRTNGLVYEGDYKCASRGTFRRSLRAETTCDDELSHALSQISLVSGVLPGNGVFVAMDLLAHNP